VAIIPATPFINKPHISEGDNIKMDLPEVGWGGVDHVAEDKDRWRAVVNAVINIRVR
jgi:hypothetical protein